VEVLGRKTDGGAVIGLVTDVLTNKTDGTISPDGDIIIEGSKIKIAPEKPKEGEQVGVFFADPEGRLIPLIFPMTENNPSRIICRVPGNLFKDAVYKLKIITRYTKGKTLLNEPRTITYELPLKVAK
jgi:hypothetical protein